MLYFSWRGEIRRIPRMNAIATTTGIPVVLKIAVAIFVPTQQKEPALNGFVTSVRQLPLYASIALAFVAVLSVARLSAATPGLPVLAKYSGAETGLHSITFDVAQDADGVLYFAGTSLLIFDGDRWSTVRMRDAYAILRLRFGPDGKLWAGGVGELGWFEKDVHGVWTYHSLRDKLPAAQANLGEVWGVAPDQDGTTFVTRESVLRWDGTSFQATPMPTAFKLFSTWSRSGFFIHHLESGLYWWRNGGPELLVPRDLLVDRAVLWAERGPSGWLLGASDGLFAYDGQKLTPYAPAVADFLKQSRLSSVRRLPDGRLAVGTLTGGMVFLRPNGSIESHLGVQHGLPSPYITSLFVSRDRELWVTTGSHIVRVDLGAHSTIFDERLGLPEQTYRKITRAGESIFVGNESGVYELAAASERFRYLDALPGRWHHLRGTRQGLFLSRFREATRWQDGKATTLLKASNDIYFTIPARADPNISLVASNRSIVAVGPGGSPRVLVRDLQDTPTSLAEDTSGVLWIGTLAGGVLFVMGVVPGMPHFAFLSLAGLACLGSYLIYWKQSKAPAAAEALSSV